MNRVGHRTGVLMGLALLFGGCAPSADPAATRERTLQVGTEPALQHAADRTIALYEASYDHVSFTVDTRSDLIDGLETGRLDAAIVIGRAADADGLQTPVGYIDLLLVSSTDSPLNGLSSNDLSLLMRYGTLPHNGMVFFLLLGDRSTSTALIVRETWLNGQDPGSSTVVFPDDSTVATYLTAHPEAITVLPETLITAQMRPLPVDDQQIVLRESVMILIPENPDRAQQSLMNWILSAEGQTALAAYITPLN